MSVSNVRISKYGNPQNPSHVYYNCDIIDSKTIDDNQFPVANFEEKRTTTVINDASKYYFSIVRFSLNGPNILLPMFVPSIKPYDINFSCGTKGDARDVTNYFLTIKVEKVSSEGEITETFLNALRTDYGDITINNVIFEPQNITSNLKKNTPFPTDGPYLDNEYYYVNNYDHVCKMLNDCMKTQIDTLVAEDFNALFPDKQYPQFVYDKDTKLFKIYLDSRIWGPNSAGEDISGNKTKLYLYMNSNLYGLFNSFPAHYLGGDLSSKNTKSESNIAYELQLIKENLEYEANKIILPLTDTINTYNPFVFKQNYISSDTLWSPVSALVFQTTLIPVLPEDTASPVQYNNDNVSGQVVSSSNFSPIITDIVITNTTADSGYSGFVNYSPAGEYRLSCLSNSPQPVSAIDVSVNWRDRLTNKLHPLKMFNGSNISLKIMFRRRDYGNEISPDMNRLGY
jgi:hypothetical protein